MRNLFTIMVLFWSLSSFQAKACPGGYVQLNKVDALSAEGFYGSKGLMVKIEDMKKLLISNGRAVYNMSEDGINVSHRVEYLGSVMEKNKIISSTYLVLEFQTNEEKVIVVRSNYQGNGLTARDSLPADSSASNKTLNKQNGFKALYEAGCQ